MGYVNNSSNWCWKVKKRVNFCAAIDEQKRVKDVFRSSSREDPCFHWWQRKKLGEFLRTGMIFLCEVRLWIK